MPSSKTPVSKRRWKTSTILLSLASIAGGFATNYLWLNPPSNTSTGTVSNTTTKTVKSDAIQYRYGVIELEVTAANGKISTIKELQSSTSPGWEEAIPLLHDASIQANGANYGNISGATFTTEAYKQALSSAMSKLG